MQAGYEHARETRVLASELKFLVDSTLAGEIRAWARRHLAPDPHGTGDAADEYRVTSIYCDTHALNVYRQVGSFGRAKYRVRRYGQEPSVFLERKLRKSRLLAKRRTRIGVDSLPLITATEAPGDWPGAWFRRRLLLRGLRPVCQISYLRMARMGTHDGPIARLTIDERLTAVPVIEPAFHDSGGVAIIDAGAVLELKFRRPLPVVFKRLIETFRLEPRPASKYRLGMSALGLATIGATAADLTQTVGRAYRAG